MGRIGNLQRGIAIGPILFVVALLAILASAIAAGSGSFSVLMTSETSRTNAAALIEIGQNLKMGFDRLMGSGIGYWGVIIGASNTTNAEDLFSPSGGGITPPSAKMGKSGAEWIYTCIYYEDSSLRRTALLQLADATLCTEINLLLGNGPTPAALDAGNPDPEEDCLSPLTTASTEAGCYESNTEGHEGFFFFQTLGIKPIAPPSGGGGSGGDIE